MSPLYNKHFKLVVIASPHSILGYDILTVSDVIPGTATGFNMSRINLTPSVRYYANVIAYNYAGTHTTSSSDGFIVDHIDPFDGIVYDGLGMWPECYGTFCVILCNFCSMCQVSL